MVFDMASGVTSSEGWLGKIHLDSCTLWDGGRLRVTWIGNFLHGILSHPMQLDGLDGAPQKGFCLPVLAMVWPHPPPRAVLSTGNGVSPHCSQYWQWYDPYCSWYWQCCDPHTHAVPSSGNGVSPHWSVQNPDNSPISDLLPQPCLNLSSTKSRASHRLPPPQPLRFESLNFTPTPFTQALSQTWQLVVLLSLPSSCSPVDSLSLSCFPTSPAPSFLILSFQTASNLIHP